MINLLSSFAITLSYETNPLNSNVFFSICQFLMILLIVFTIVAGIITLVARASNLPKLDITASRWLTYLSVSTLYLGVLWIGLSMFISYVGNSVLDTINSIIILIIFASSLIKRASSDQQSANRTLLIAYIFIAVFIVWSLVSGSLISALPEEFRTVSGTVFQPKFFTDLFHLWHWM